jgi:hypothetical protein
MQTLAESVYEPWYKDSEASTVDLVEACLEKGAQEFYYNDGTEADAFVFEDRSWVFIVWGGGATGCCEHWNDNTLGSNGKPQPLQLKRKDPPEVFG